jgi:trehalose utilization protein
MYGERFDIPTPDKVIFISWFEGGEVLRSGVTYQRGHGKIFYFQPGHEIYPIYYNEQIIRVIGNSVRWAKPAIIQEDTCPKVQPLENIKK